MGIQAEVGQVFVTCYRAVVGGGYEYYRALIGPSAINGDWRAEMWRIKGPIGGETTPRVKVEREGYSADGDAVLTAMRQMGFHLLIDSAREIPCTKD